MTDVDEPEVIAEIAGCRALQVLDCLVEPVATTVQVDVERGPGFAATGKMTTASDLDVLVVRPMAVDADGEAAWHDQLDELQSPRSESN